MIKTILWDVDGTLLDFQAAERAAIRTLFGAFHLGECTDEMLRRYSAINVRYWEMLERGEMTKPQILVRRFETFFKETGIDPGLAPAFNALYQVRLGDTIVYRDDSPALVRSLRGKIRQYVVSNGTVVAQRKKLALSGLGELMDEIFLSEELGAEKPNAAFFDAVFAAIDEKDKRRVLVIGDSLGSDIQGAANAGLDCVWYNPKGLANDRGLPVTLEATTFAQILAFLDGAAEKAGS